MRAFHLLPIVAAAIMIVRSCGVEGDPGHCYFSLDWEYYNEDYGVYYYEDNNPVVPEAEEIVRNYYYDCYPGRYDYFYESEDEFYYYSYEGYYELVQNPGTRPGLFTDGYDGADTYFDLYLPVYNKKSANNKQSDHRKAFRANESWELEKKGWKLKFRQTMTATPKEKIQAGRSGS